MTEQSKKSILLYPRVYEVFAHYKNGLGHEEKTFAYKEDVFSFLTRNIQRIRYFEAQKVDAGPIVSDDVYDAVEIVFFDKYMLPVPMKGSWVKKTIENSKCTKFHIIHSEQGELYATYDDKVNTLNEIKYRTNKYDWYLLSNMKEQATFFKVFKGNEFVSAVDENMKDIKGRFTSIQEFFDADMIAKYRAGIKR